MANLVPKHLVDKNGVPTTRMVRPNNGQAVTLRLPAPPAPSTPDMAARAIVDMVANWIEENSASKRDQVAAHLEFTLGEDGVQEIHDRVAALPEEDKTVFGAEVMNMLIRREFTAFRLRAMHTMIDAIPIARKFADTDASEFLQKEMPMIAAMGDLNSVRMGNTDPVEDQMGIKYLTFLRCTNSNPEKVYFSDLKTAAKWFNENSDALIPYADLLRKRGGADLGFLKELVRGDGAAPLSNGLL